MKRSTAAKIAGLSAWEQNPQRMLTIARSGGQACRDKHGRSFYVRIAALRWDRKRKEEAKGRRQRKEAAGAGVLRATSLERRLPASHLRLVPPQDEATA
jgi:hypothetical protein